jgi:peptidoglycan/xylan/chitin deacetylase (PgdA/CDA1 family)
MPKSSIISIDTKDGPPNVVLTYDDGPEPIGTHEVLGALADAKVTATFFVLLTRTRLNPSLVKEIQSQGHEIALHGVNHKSLLDFSPEEVFTRTRDAKIELEDLIGQPIKWFRPPYGQQTSDHVREIHKTGLTPVLWNVICHDWADVTHEFRVEEVRKVDKAGAILLAHDNIACAPDGVEYDPCPPFSRGELSRSMIEIFTTNGFKCCGLSDALKTGKPIWE